MITPEILVKIPIFFIPFLFSLCFHEYAHGWVARKLGDNTAWMMGRLTLNPMAHIDWMGTVIIPIMAILFPGLPLFGWARPVPVNARNLRHPKKDMFWVALAGPLSNILLFVVGLAVLALVLKQHFFEPSISMYEMFVVFLRLNLYLAFFNLLPLHPLDGGKVLARFLPIKWDILLERYEAQMQMVLMLLVIFGGLQFLALPVNWVLDQSINFVEAL